MLTLLREVQIPLLAALPAWCVLVEVRPGDAIEVDGAGWVRRRCSR